SAGYSRRLGSFEGGRGMVFRTAGAVAALLLGLTAIGSDQASAQYYPPRAYPPQAYPPAQAYPPHRPLPTLAAADDDAPFYDPVPGRPVPPVGVGQEALPPPGLPVGRQGVEEADLPPPLPGAALREPPPGYIPIDPAVRAAHPAYGVPPGA